jgi:ligand-binding SRPBCC domain-containing protein
LFDKIAVRRSQSVIPAVLNGIETIQTKDFSAGYFDRLARNRRRRLHETDMKEHLFKSELWLARSPAEIFPFFADAKNLGTVTPPWLHFEILTPGHIEMGVGTLIDYRISLHGIPLRWRTRITAWEPPFRFVDEQVKGPYRRWIHEHHFTKSGTGTLCHDQVHYAILGGRIVQRLLVEPDVKRIFAFRATKLTELFVA